MREFGIGQECSTLEQVRCVLERDPQHSYTLVGIDVGPDIGLLRVNLSQFNGDATLRCAAEELRQESPSGKVLVVV